MAGGDVWISGRKLREARIAEHLTPEKLSAITARFKGKGKGDALYPDEPGLDFVSVRTIQRIESAGKRGEDTTATVTTLASLAKALDLPVQALQPEGKTIPFVEDILAQISKHDAVGRRGWSTGESAAARLGIMPPPPGVVVGREQQLDQLRAKIQAPSGHIDGHPIQVVTAVRGLAGVGKSTILSEVYRRFPEFSHVLYVEIGQLRRRSVPSVLLSNLRSWYQALCPDSSWKGDRIGELQGRLRGILARERALIIVDDVWESQHAAQFLVGGDASVTLFGTRDYEVARQLASATGIITLDCLSEADSILLLESLAGDDFVELYHPQCKRLVNLVGGLPLALHVAGKMLLAYKDRGDDARRLFTELDDLTRLLEQTAPVSMSDAAKLTTPTVAAVLAKSTEQLPAKIRRRFRKLGSMPHSTSTLSLSTLATLWETDEDDARETAAHLCDRSLLGLAGGNRFRIHAVLAAHARTMGARRGKSTW